MFDDEDTGGVWWEILSIAGLLVLILWLVLEHGKC
jgi:hypothetical protein